MMTYLPPRTPFDMLPFCPGLNSSDPKIMRARLLAAFEKARLFADAHPGPEGDPARRAIEEAKLTLDIASHWSSSHLEKSCRSVFSTGTPRR